MTHQYFEDLHVGQTFGSGTVTVTADEIKTFAKQYDPQPFHLDESAAKGSFFGELVASGWNTAALTMRLLVDGEYRPAGGMIGGRADEMQWPQPTRPGDVLSCRTEILELRPSSKRTDQGHVKMRTTTFNTSKEPVFVLEMNGIVRRKPTS